MKSFNILLPAAVFLTLICGNLQAQPQKTWEWVRQLGGHSRSIASSVSCDGKNNLFVVGTFRDTLYGNTEKVISSGNQDIFIARYDEKGKIKDLLKGGGAGYDDALCMTVLNNNNVVVGGIITDSVSFDKVSAAGKGTRLFITCLGEKGFSWISTLAAKSGSSLFLLDKDANGNIYAAGVFSDTLRAGDKMAASNGKKDIFLARYNASGTIEELISFGSDDDDLPSALTVSDSGNVYLAGIIKRTCIVDDINLIPPSSTYKSTPFVIRFDNSLQAQQKMQLMGDKFLKISALKSDRLNNLYVMGNFNLSFTCEDTVFTSVGHTDGFLLKFDKTGKRLWGRSFGSTFYDYANHLLTDHLNGTIITGSIGDTLVIDNMMAAPLSDKDATLILQFTPEGKAIWVDCVSGNGSNFSNGSVLDGRGNLYITGNFSHSFEKNDETLTAMGKQDVFLARYYNCPEGTATIIGDTVICNGATTELRIEQSYSQITWNDTLKGTSYILAGKPGLYTVALFDKRGCMLTDTVEVVLAPPSDFSLGDDVSLPVEGTLLLKAPEEFTDYKWHDNAEGATYLAKTENNTPGTYLFSLSAVDAMGCTASDTIAIEFFLTLGWVDPDKVQLTAYPNPVGNELYWSINTENPCRLILEVMDDNGRLILNQYIEHYQPSEIKTVNFTDIPPGQYYIRIRNGSGQGSQHVSVVRL